MSADAIFSAGFLLLLLCYSGESCVQKHVQAQVPEKMLPGYVVCKVDLALCGVRHLHLTSTDPDFTIQRDGTVSTAQVTTVPGSGKYFWIKVRDEEHQRWKVHVKLSSTDPKSQTSSNVVHKRFKRRWSPPPFNIVENDVGPFPKDVEVIASDSNVNYTVYYTIDGPGITEPPIRLLTVEKETGLVKIHGPVDREMYPNFTFRAHAMDRFTNKERDKFLPVTVIVLDVNDNAPEFVKNSLFFSVQEHCNPGTSIGRVNATDKDDPTTDHAKLKFSLKNGTDLFKIDPYSGIISALTDTLDRETQENIYVTIEVRDMGGEPNGLFNTAVAVVSLTDINDNAPTFTETLYKGKVMENKADVLVLRVPVQDKDLKNTPNWKAVYEITKGNETGNFLIKTDPVTNEGLLYVMKPLDYEKQKVVNLEVMARNENPLVKTTPVWNKTPVEITVENEDEGPEFSPSVLHLKVKENIPNGTTIGTYSALDPETSSSKGIKYYKITDPGSWINVMESTGELKTAKTIDRESPLVYNNTYNITVKAVDETQKTGTGTVFILIEDVNDNEPKIVNPDKVLCLKDNAWGSTLLEAVDYDQPPYSGPFTFALGKEAEGTWKLKRATDTSAVLEQTVDLANDIYKVPVQVKDLQGSGEVQIVTVRVCECVRNGECKAQSVSRKLGPGGILALLLAPLLLLLLCLLCVFACTTKREKMAFALDDADGSLFKSNSEAPGEEAKAPFIIPASGLDTMDSLKGGYLEHQNSFSTAGGGGGGGIGGFGQHTIQRDSMYQTNMQSHMINTLNSGQYGTGVYGGTINKFTSDMSTIDRWTTTGMHLQERMINLHQKPRERYADDILKPYGVEGTGSPAGSVGCCSILEEQNTLDFLDSLGPKFKTLADVCTSKMDGNRL
ncbi:desmocollin 2-like protein [Trichomycterus rosablanca]|uniref:desmocollin 2-like protein n=1 Tax=Trichomycterus rosablanca TaxID=2290929 RepID=UPI002F360C46